MDKYSEKRPWGSFERFSKNEPCTVKVLFINPGQELSLQYHQKRDEFIKIVQGQAKVTIDDKITEAAENDDFFIPRKTKHRIRAEKRPVKILEISFGEFDEKDEIRLEDKYRRI